VLTDTTPARAGIVAGRQLKDQRILVPGPAATKLADLFVVVFCLKGIADVTRAHHRLH
jgi:hypothetical protein